MAFFLQSVFIPRTYVKKNSFLAVSMRYRKLMFGILVSVTILWLIISIVLVKTPCYYEHHASDNIQIFGKNPTHWCGFELRHVGIMFGVGALANIFIVGFNIYFGVLFSN